MFPLYEPVIAPLLEAAEARRVVEIGALRGRTTERLLELLGPEGELHVIDPEPRFDPAEHERGFPGRYVFHRRPSHEALPELPPVDAAIVDGDHNWFTVHGELELLDRAAREAGAPLPLLIVHDVGWPYGRRDLYYEPDRIPEQHRQPYAQRGLLPGREELVPRGGLNRAHNNALREGGPRNGVMTAVDDFLAETDRSLRLVVLPLFFGLAIVAERELLESRPSLADGLDRLESAEGRLELLELAESWRVAQLARAQADSAEEREARATGRYLEVVKAALLNEHYPEHELRLDYLSKSIELGREPSDERLRDPAKFSPREYRVLRAERRSGAPAQTLAERAMHAYTTIGHTGLDHLERCLDSVREQGLEGDLAVCGAWRGGSAVFMRAFCEAHELEGPRVWVADTFSGSPEAPEDQADGSRFPDLAGDLNGVREGFARFDLLDERVRFLQGAYDDTLADAPIAELALLDVGTEGEEETRQVLEQLYDRVVAGGFVVVEHGDAPGCRRAVDEFRARRGIEEPIERVDWSGFSWRKGEAAALTAPGPLRERPRAPVPPPAPAGAADLSVIVVAHDMHRAAQRTLHSLSRSYQRGIDGLDYEVIVVENGSSERGRLGEELVRGFGPQFRYLDLGAESTPSPAHALNRGVEIARGQNLALMIDGAHVLSPGVLRFGMLGLRTYSPAVVTTHQWYVGPGQQGEAMDGGYDEEYEDRLFEEIDWPGDGYRLFQIGSFIGERDWFDNHWESNCFFVPRALMEQAGGYDETFAVPGGGYTNLDLFERLTTTPGVNVVDIIGEASFHQLHGGTTTNQPDVEERHARLGSYRREYQEIRGRPFRNSGKPRHVVGSILNEAAHTRPRWRTGLVFREAQRLGPGEFPDKGVPVSDELDSEFTDAYWRSLAWRDTSWLGVRAGRPAGDLLAYQELVARTRPDWILDTHTGSGGRALFLASICELLGSGRVLSIRRRAEGNFPEHPRITYLTGNPMTAPVQEEVRRTIGEGQETMLVIALARRGGVLRLFEAFSPLVPVGGYAVVEDTVLNGHPVMPEFGPGPTEAVREILQAGDFVADSRMERFGPTFNPGGFLKRVG